MNSSRASSFYPPLHDREGSMPLNERSGTDRRDEMKQIRNNNSSITEKHKRRSYSSGSMRGFTSKLFKGKQQQQQQQQQSNKVVTPSRSKSLTSIRSPPTKFLDKSVRDQQGEGVELMSDQNELSFSPLVLPSKNKKNTNRALLPPRNIPSSGQPRKYSEEVHASYNAHSLSMKLFETSLEEQETEYSESFFLEERRKMKERDGFCLPVAKYDDQNIWCSTRSKPDYILGNYLGGGVAGVVYEANRFIEKKQGEKVAIKILNPVSFRLATSALLADAVIVREGEMLSQDILRRRKPMTEKHVWWVVNPNSRNLRTLRRPSNVLKESNQIDRGSEDKGLRLSLIAAYRDDEGLKELPLNRCIEIWGHAPFGASESDFDEMMDAIERANSSSSRTSTVSIPLTATTTSSSSATSVPNEPARTAMLSNTSLFRAVVSQRSIVYSTELSSYIAVPAVPPKYLRWLRQRRAATKEFRNMLRIGRHVNVVHLYEVLEYVQESKSTMFLVLELVTGGELFDLISSPNPNRTHTQQSFEGEEMMQKFFRELVSGIEYCHVNGIAHRDLKPENLLVHYGDGDDCTLKIADFGLSAAFGISALALNSESEHIHDSNFCSDGSNQNWQRVQSSSSITSGFSPLFGKAIGDALMGPGRSFSAAFNLGSFLNCGNVSSVYDANDSTLSFTGGLCADTSVAIPPKQPSHPACPLRRMTSVVGSPHYVAPEIISQAGSSSNSNGNGLDADQDQNAEIGYDGTKADVWSTGVILYAMLFRSLPFGEDLLRCPRFVSYNKWYDQVRLKSRSSNTSFDDESLLGPKWFFPSSSSRASRDLIVSMLNPDPVKRISIEKVQKHPWVNQ